MAFQDVRAASATGVLATSAAAASPPRKPAVLNEPPAPMPLRRASAPLGNGAVVGLPERGDVVVETSPTRRTYRFGRYLLDVPRRMLLCGPTARPIPEKLFLLLLTLLEANGEVVTKDRFFAEIWPDDVVSDANLAQHVFLLRGLLGERAKDHAYVVTVPGSGYRFAAEVEHKV